ncbi:MAG: hypothetical protein A3A08_01600 [Candidatus Nealsonbacteria bacterium RIFCSPLOWO2_01_FULL_41_9]|uniref:Uncharacterized protein n=1 Tax=Candidatus Nealsonbacteria bacterium RIFCSPLOWO2_01_FULL_41_9 TaxID=1801671 RepID=A0A1G2ECF1_9BACT|nr:MAG: hypothetical protein A3A08_01600 [Candidatus Nealsonbacteria bacterium RIFCSPLOWO2_01_FULL_41_9]
MYFLGPMKNLKRLAKMVSKVLPPIFIKAILRAIKVITRAKNKKSAKFVLAMEKYKTKIAAPAPPTYINCLKVRGPAIFASCSIN